MKDFEILSYLHASLNNKVFVPFLNFKTFFFMSDIQYSILFHNVE